jgi:hypothetical protein
VGPPRSGRKSRRGPAPRVALPAGALTGADCARGACQARKLGDELAKALQRFQEVVRGALHKEREFVAKVKCHKLSSSDATHPPTGPGAPGTTRRAALTPREGRGVSD